ncbi:uncharacterized protein LOC144912583 isoform X1 [Branchiostoma floridae x Branchiostoma belcheri]
MPETRDDGKQESAKQKNVKSVQFNLSDNTTILLEPEHERTGGNVAVNGSPYGNHMNHKKPEESNSIMSAEIEKLNEELKALRDKLEEEVEELRQEVNYKRKTYLAQSKELDALVEQERTKREENLQEIKSEIESKIKDRQQRCDKLDKDLTARETDIDERTKTVEEREKELHKREKEIERRVEQCETNDSQVSDWEKELVTRKKTCQDFQQELDDMERYLDKRQEMCNSKDDDLKMLDEELSRLRAELQKNIDSMEEDAVQENAEVIGRLRSDWEALKAKRRQAVSNLVQQTANRLSATSPSAVVGNTAEKTAEGTTVLQAVVRKLQHDLQEAENSMEKKDQEICQLGRKVLFLETELQKRDQKAKQLEAQLTISLGEIRRKESTERQEPSHRKDQDRSANSTQEGHRARSGTWGAESRGSRSSSHREEGPRSDKSSSSSGSRHSIMKEYDMNSSKACSIM